MSTPQEGTATTPGVQVPHVAAYPRLYGLAYPSGVAATTGTLQIGQKTIQLPEVDGSVSDPTAAIQQVMQAAVDAAAAAGLKQIAQTLQSVLTAVAALNLNFPTSMVMGGKCGPGTLTAELNGITTVAVFFGSGSEDCDSLRYDVVTGPRSLLPVPDGTTVTVEVAGAEPAKKIVGQTGSGTATLAIGVTVAGVVTVTLTVTSAADYVATFRV